MWKYGRAINITASILFAVKAGYPLERQISER
jgi:hypothetical protein